MSLQWRRGQREAREAEGGEAREAEGHGQAEAPLCSECRWFPRREG